MKSGLDAMPLFLLDDLLNVILKSEPYLLLTSADCIDYKTGLVFSQQFPNEIINFRFTVIWFVVIVAITHNKPSSQHLNLLRPFKMFSAIKRWIFCQEVKKASKQYTSKGHSFCKQCLHNLQFIKTRYISWNLSNLARADISCQFMKTRSLCKTVYKMNGL